MVVILARVQNQWTESKFWKFETSDYTNIFFKGLRNYKWKRKNGWPTNQNRSQRSTSKCRDRNTGGRQGANSERETDARTVPHAKTFFPLFYLLCFIFHCHITPLGSRTQIGYVQKRNVHYVRWVPSSCSLRHHEVPDTGNHSNYPCSQAIELHEGKEEVFPPTTLKKLQAQKFN